MLGTKAAPALWKDCCMHPSVLSAPHDSTTTRAHHFVIRARAIQVAYCRSGLLFVAHSLITIADAKLKNLSAQSSTAGIPALRGCCSSSDRARTSVASSKRTPQPAQSRLDSSLMGIMYASGSFFAPWLASLFTKLMKSTSYTAAGTECCQE